MKKTNVMVVLALLLSAQHLHTCGEWFWFPPEQVKSPKAFEIVSSNPLFLSIFARRQTWARLLAAQRAKPTIHEPAQADALPGESCTELAELTISDKD